MNATHPMPSVIDLRAEPGQIRCFDPATREPLGLVPVDDPEQVRQAIARAREAQIGWGETSFALRRRVLRRVADSILDRVEKMKARRQGR